jgi:hypothetical protein
MRNDSAVKEATVRHLHPLTHILHPASPLPPRISPPQLVLQGSVLARREL